MIELERIHHIAIICSDYQKSKTFYTDILGFRIEQEVFRSERNSYKLDLSLHGTYIIELFSFPSPPKRVSRPEAAGLRHLAFAVQDLDKQIDHLKSRGVEVEPIRIDEYSGKKFTFFEDPDGLPLELYESN